MGGGGYWLWEEGVTDYGRRGLLTMGGEGY